MVEPRLERAAEESRDATVNGWQVLPDGGFGCRSCCHSRLRGNGLHKPLDSGLRRNDDGALRNDAEDYQNVSTPSVVIPAKARLQGCRW